MATFSTQNNTLDLGMRSGWSDGLIAVLTYTAGQAMNGWTATFDYPGEIVNIWNAREVPHEGDRFIVESLGYNSNLSAGASASFGLQGSGSDHEITPVALAGELIDGPVAPDTDPVHVVTVTGGAVTEADRGMMHVHDDGQRFITFVVTLETAASEEVVLDYTTADETAVADTTSDVARDYHTTAGKLVFAPAQTMKMVTVAVHPDTEVEPVETFTFGVTGDGRHGESGGFVGGGTIYSVGSDQVVTDFDPTRDRLELGPASFHNEFPVDTPDGFMVLNMFNASQSLLLEGVYLADRFPENVAPIADAQLQQDLSAVVAYEDGSGFSRPNTIYIRSDEEGLVETVDSNPETDKISFLYLRVCGDGERNFAVQEAAGGRALLQPADRPEPDPTGRLIQRADKRPFRVAREPA